MLPLVYHERDDAQGYIARLFHHPGANRRTVGVGGEFQQWTWLVHETGADGCRFDALSDTGLHILYAEDETACWVDIGGRRIDAHPGDSLLAYDGDPIDIAPGLLVVVCTGNWKSRRRRRRATHGQERFYGYNRRTTYDETRHMAFDRWKVTEPAQIVGDEPVVLLCIFGAVAASAGSEIANLHPGEAVAFRGGMAIIPDGLAYVMTIWDPEFSRGVIAEPLRISPPVS